MTNTRHLESSGTGNYPVHINSGSHIKQVLNACFILLNTSVHSGLGISFSTLKTSSNYTICVLHLQIFSNETRLTTDGTDPPLLI